MSEQFFVMKDGEKEKKKLPNTYDEFMKFIYDYYEVREEDIPFFSLECKIQGTYQQLNSPEVFAQLLAEKKKKELRGGLSFSKLVNEVNKIEQQKKFYLLLLKIKKERYERERKLINKIVEENKESLPEVADVEIPFKSGTSTNYEHKIKCNGCKCEPIKGMRYICAVCLSALGEDFNLCQKCKSNLEKGQKVHDHNYFIEIDNSEKYDDQR